MKRNPIGLDWIWQKTSFMLLVVIAVASRYSASNDDAIPEYPQSPPFPTCRTPVLVECEAYMRGVNSKPALGGQFYTVGDTAGLYPACVSLRR